MVSFIVLISLLLLDVKYSLLVELSLLVRIWEHHLKEDKTADILEYLDISETTDPLHLKRVHPLPLS